MLWRPFIPNTRFAFNYLLEVLQLIPPQETIPVTNKIENILSRIAALEALLATRPCDVAEQRRRTELIRYAIVFSLRLDVEFLPDSSRASRDNCSHWTGRQGYSNMLAPLKAMKLRLGTLMLYKRSSSTTRFVHNPTLSSMLTRTTDCTTNDDL